MAESLLIGGAVGAGMQEPLKLALKSINKGLQFKPTLETSMKTLEALAPIVEEIKQINKEMDRPTEAVERLDNEIKAGKELVKKCSNVRWWKFPTFPWYQDKLQASDKKISRNLSMDMQAQIARDLTETLSKVTRILETLVSKDYAGEGRDGKVLKGLSGAPQIPEFIVGLDEPLKKLKVEILRRDCNGASVILLTGVGGSGKSTLAKKLCWDNHVKGMFRENIFFVTVSKSPNLKTIVQALFDHCERRAPEFQSGAPEFQSSAPEFQSDEDAINKLGILLEQVSVGGCPVLLVLDDVWPGSETLVEKFKFQISDYKIMVTSRVAFPRFRTQCHLKPLDHDDAMSLFHHFAQLKATSSYKPDENLVQEIVKGCKGSPLALEVIGGSLCQQPYVVWEIMKERLQKSMLESNDDLLSRLQNSLDILEDIKEKECFMDLGLFPEDQRIRVPALIDMWTELHDLDEDGQKAMNIIYSLTTKNLANVMNTRRVAMEADMYYNNHFLMQHDLLRELAIHQSNQDPFEQRKRLVIDLSQNNRPEGWAEQNQQGMISRLLSFFPMRLMEQKHKQVAARTLSISTDEAFTSDWSNILPNETKVLVLNIRSSKYTLPEFTQKMSKLKVLIATNYGFHPSELHKFDILSYLPYLKRIRLEKVSVPHLCILRNLQKLSLHMCNTKQAFQSSDIKISDALPNLVEMNIDYCKDLLELPSDLCNITTIKKLSITSCHNLSKLPQEIGNLQNLEMLRFNSCSDLEEIPESVALLHNLRCLDISDCVSLAQLPVDIGNLCNLQKLYMWGCSKLSELPYSVMNFKDLKHKVYVICDEEVATLWEHFNNLPNLKIEVSKADISLNWLHGVSS